MLRSFRSKKGQGVTGEYVALIALVSVAITAMTVYVRRTLQARAYDADRYMVTSAASALGNSIAFEYEPYYKQQASNTDAEKTSQEMGVTGGTSYMGTSQNAVAAAGDQKSPLQQ